MNETRYDLVEIFASMQGEGRNSGRPCTFVRFAGCNLCCPWCDTERDKRFSLTAGEILAEVESLGNRSVILTGGEPTAVPGMDGLVRSLKAAGLWLAVETNGTNAAEWLNEVDYVACSPKAEFPDSLRLTRADEVRIVASPAATADYCRTARRRIKASDYYISPCETDGEFDFAAAKSLLGELKTWSLSVQLHKLLGFR